MSSSQRPRRTRVSRHESPLGRWEMVEATPDPVLRPHVRRYVGWFEDMATPLRRRELPTSEVPLIINFDSPVRLEDDDGSGRTSELGSFITGAYDRHVIVSMAGPSGGLQIDLTILGARLLLDRPLFELRNRGVPLEWVLGGPARSFTAQLRDLRSWEARFAMADRWLAARMSPVRQPSAGVLCAWHRLAATGGRVPIRAIAAETGWSRKHLIDRFRQEIGLSPKTFARVLRFGAAVTLLRQGRVGTLTELAHATGYYDQSHFVRDTRALSGVSPRTLAASLLPDGGGFDASR